MDVKRQLEQGLRQLGQKRPILKSDAYDKKLKMKAHLFVLFTGFTVPVRQVSDWCTRYSL
jgi:hypothetical protein